MNNVEHYNLFPTAVVKGSIGREISQQEFDVVEKYKKIKNYANYISEDKYVLDKDLPEIREFIQQNIDYYVDNVMCPLGDLQFYITQSWLNWTENGQYHHKHQHQNSIISGVFYFNADPSVDKITFYNERYRQIHFNNKTHNPSNSDSWWLPSKTGDVIIFPSNLYHSVDTVVTETPRISLAFNVFVRGTFGSELDVNAITL